MKNNVEENGRETSYRQVKMKHKKSLWSCHRLTNSEVNLRLCSHRGLFIERKCKAKPENYANFMTGYHVLAVFTV